MPWINKRFVDDIAEQINSMRDSNDASAQAIVACYDTAIQSPTHFRVRGRGEQIMLDVPDNYYWVMQEVANSRIVAWDKKLAEATNPIEKDVARRGIRRSKKVLAKFNNK